MRKIRYTAKYVKKKQSGIISTQGGWGPRAITGQVADAIVSKIGSHYVVSIILKPTFKDERVLALNTHFNEYMKVLWSIITNDVGGNPNVYGKGKGL
jgi:hypothetical protein